MASTAPPHGHPSPRCTLPPRRHTKDRVSGRARRWLWCASSGVGARGIWHRHHQGGRMHTRHGPMRRAGELRYAGARLTAGQRRQVEHTAAALRLGGVDQRIRQREAPLRVRVVDLDRGPCAPPAVRDQRDRQSCAPTPRRRPAPPRPQRSAPARCLAHGSSASDPDACGGH
jgi:hypothetical protein